MYKLASHETECISKFPLCTFLVNPLPSSKEAFDFYSHILARPSYWWNFTVPTLLCLSSFTQNAFLKKKNNFYYLFIYWLCWVFVSVRGLSLVVASGGHSSSRCAGLSLPRPLWLRSTGSSRAGSVVVAHGPSCSAACGIFPDQGSTPCPLHWQADSQPLRHQGSPWIFFFN